MPLRQLRGPGLCLAVLTLVLLASSCARNDPEPRPSALTQEPTSSSTEAASSESFNIFFSKVSDDCSEVGAVRRQADGEPTVAEALDALLGGPTSEEKAQGANSLFSQATRDLLITAEVTKGVANVDFADLRPVIPNASSSCGSTALLAQLDATVKQFGASQSLYSINGQATTFYEWLQRPLPDA